MKSKEYWVIYMSTITEEVRYLSDEDEIEKSGYPIKDHISKEKTTIEKHGLRYIVYGEGCKYEGV